MARTRVFLFPLSFVGTQRNGLPDQLGRASGEERKREDSSKSERRKVGQISKVATFGRNGKRWRLAGEKEKETSCKENRENREDQKLKPRIGFGWNTEVREERAAFRLAGAQTGQ